MENKSTQISSGPNNEVSMKRLPKFSINRTLSKKIVNPKKNIICKTINTRSKYKIDKSSNIYHSNSSNTKANNSVQNRFKIISKANPQKIVYGSNNQLLSNSTSNHQASKSPTKSTNSYSWQPKSSTSANPKTTHAKCQQSSNLKTKSTYKLVNHSISDVGTGSNPVNYQQNKVQLLRNNQSKFLSVIDRYSM